MSFSTEQQRVGIALDELFPTATRTGAGQVSVVSCVSDWREVQPSDVYVALPEGCSYESTDDGHLHAKRAVACGAIAVICEQPVPVFDVPTYLVPDSRVALGLICHALMGNPTQSLPTIGITGTQGKSTTIALVDAIFAADGKECGVLSSMGCYDGMAHSQGISEAPSAPALASRLANMTAAPCDHALLEVTSRSLSQHTVAGIQLDAVCVTNVTEAHLDLHNSVQSYRDTKQRILELLSPTGITILNADDPVCMQWIDRVPGPVLTYGIKRPAEVRARQIEMHCNEQVFLLMAGSDSVAVRTALIGEHHISNCLAAATVALAYGIDLQTIAAGLQSVESLPGRMERVDCGQGFPVYLDAAETPTALRSALRAARQVTLGRVICVLGERQSLSGLEEYTLQQIAQRMSDLAITTRPMATSEHEDAALIEIAADRNSAIAIAVSMANPGDVVVIAGTQSGPCHTFGQSTAATNDVDTTRELLYARNRTTLRIAA